MFGAAIIRHDKAGGTSYFDVVSSQQTLVSLIGNYLAALNDQWTAVIDIANLLQTPDLFQTHAVDHVEPIPDVYEIFRRERRHR